MKTIARVSSSQDQCRNKALRINPPENRPQQVISGTHHSHPGLGNAHCHPHNIASLNIQGHNKG